MQIAFGGGTHGVPDGVVIGVLGCTGSGVRELLAVAESPIVVVDYEFDKLDAFEKAGQEAKVERMRRGGSSLLLASHDVDLLRRVSDEIWWVDGGRIVLKADPNEAIAAYQRHIHARVRESLAGAIPELQPSSRRGDGRAELIELATLDSAGRPTGGWNSGEEAVVLVKVRFHAAVADPVVGIMIRTRIGMEVYGTNTELERVQVGPCQPGDVRTIEFRFACNLCPQTYTLTAASHDPDGVWHDWLEDAIAFSVADTRYTAGVANLRAAVTCSRE